MNEKFLNENSATYKRKKMGKHSAGIIVVRQANETWLFLVLRCYRNWDFPKGIVEPGEEPLQAAIRETIEETSISELRFLWGHQYKESEPYGDGKVVQYFIAATTTSEVVFGINPEIGRSEHHEYRWVRLDEARQLLPQRLWPILEWASNLVVNRCVLHHP
jgi:8-oxo-dGTP pyrophosphatase MutT (NUDIX family)